MQNRVVPARARRTCEFASLNTVYSRKTTFRRFTGFLCEPHIESIQRDQHFHTQLNQPLRFLKYGTKHSTYHPAVLAVCLDTSQAGWTRGSLLIGSEHRSQDFSTTNDAYSFRRGDGNKAKRSRFARLNYQFNSLILLMIPDGSETLVSPEKLV